MLAYIDHPESHAGRSLVVGDTTSATETSQFGSDSRVGLKDEKAITEHSLTL